MPQHVERHPPGATGSCADGGCTLIDAHDHARDAPTIAIVEGDGISSLELARRRLRRCWLRWWLVGRLLGRPLSLGGKSPTSTVLDDQYSEGLSLALVSATSKSWGSKAPPIQALR